MSERKTQLVIFCELFEPALQQLTSVYMRHRPEKGDSWKVADPGSLRALFTEEIWEYLEAEEMPDESDELMDILNLGLMLLVRLLELHSMEM